LFLYLAFQSVHNPYDVPPIDVNKTFPKIVNYERRIYAGMVKMMDDAIQRVVSALQDAALWDDTILIFTTDNGGIGAGSNYPLRGTKVFNWEGGIKGVGFVRGTNNPMLAPLPPNTTCNALMHTTDWFPTLVEGVAGGDIGSKTLPLDGYNQWEVLAGRDITKRISIFHQVPIGGKAIRIMDTTDRKNDDVNYTSSMCMHWVDNRTFPCSIFGITGGAIRHGDYKLLITYPGESTWTDTSSPLYAYQYTPGGNYLNGTPVFIPETDDIHPEPFRGKYYLFDIAKDPTESINLAMTMPLKLAFMIHMYEDYAKTAVPSLDWRWGFTDPTYKHNPSVTDDMVDSSTIRRRKLERHFGPDGEVLGGLTCLGPFLGSEYCSYGHEWECYVMRNALHGCDLGCAIEVEEEEGEGGKATVTCQALCALNDKCKYWVLINNTQCQLKSCRGKVVPCEGCVFGPKSCPS
jgi:hypothetical protein